MFKKAIVVLGCGIDPAGNLNPDAENSVRLALQSHKHYPDACLIMTGFMSYKATFKPSISEAQAMKDYALSLGVSGDKIFVETESKDTMGNLYFTKQNLLIPLHIKDIVIVRGPNQSDERINYLATKILGTSYNYELVRPDVKRPEEFEREMTSLGVAKEWLDAVANGDMPAVYRILRTRHPAYNSSISIDSLQKLL